MKLTKAKRAEAGAGMIALLLILVCVIAYYEVVPVGGGIYVMGVGGLFMLVYVGFTAVCLVWAVSDAYDARKAEGAGA